MPRIAKRYSLREPFCNCAESNEDKCGRSGGNGCEGQLRRRCRVGDDADRETVTRGDGCGCQNDCAESQPGGGCLRKLQGKDKQSAQDCNQTCGKAGRLWERS